MKTLSEAIQLAKEVKEARGYTVPAKVYKHWVYAGRFVFGFNFRSSSKVGDVIVNDDGTKMEIMAVV